MNVKPGRLSPFTVAVILQFFSMLEKGSCIFNHFCSNPGNGAFCEYIKTILYELHSKMLLHNWSSAGRVGMSCLGKLLPDRWFRSMPNNPKYGCIM